MSRHQALARAAASSASASGLALILDDDVIVGPLVEAVLARAGLASRLAETAAEAHAMLDRGHFGLVVLNANLASPGSVEFLRQLGRRPAFRRPSILARIMPGQATLRGLLRAAGADGFITEPFANAELAERVGALLARPAAAGVAVFGRAGAPGGGGEGRHER